MSAPRESLFPARCGSGRAIHAAKDYSVLGYLARGTLCGFRTRAENPWIARCDLEPITCKSCLKAKAKLL